MLPPWEQQRPHHRSHRFLPATDSDAYQQLRTFVPVRPSAATLERLGLVGLEPSAAVDRRLLEARGTSPAHDATTPA
jgi:hypothetical protein